MRYAYVQNGVVIDGPRGLPKAWGNTSGFNLLSDAELAEFGWFPWRLVEVQPPSNDWKLIESSIEIKPTEIVETQQYGQKTQQEIDDEANGLAQQNKIFRAQAYREESDPIFFKAQRNEATMQEWLDKVNEIKTRFPY